MFILILTFILIFAGDTVGARMTAVVRGAAVAVAVAHRRRRSSGSVWWRGTGRRRHVGKRAERFVHGVLLQGRRRLHGLHGGLNIQPEAIIRVVVVQGSERIKDHAFDLTTHTFHVHVDSTQYWAVIFIDQPTGHAYHRMMIVVVAVVVVVVHDWLPSVVAMKMAIVANVRFLYQVISTTHHTHAHPSFFLELIHVLCGWLYLCRCTSLFYASTKRTGIVRLTRIPLTFSVIILHVVARTSKSYYCQK